jgi:hypothetical protein
VPDGARSNGHVLLGLTERRRHAHDLAVFEVLKQGILTQIMFGGDEGPPDLFTDVSARPSKDPRRRTAGWGVVRQ